MMTLETKLCGLMLKNPLIAASGTFGFGEEFMPYMDVSSLGAICSKGLTLHPKEGNPGTRMWETPSGMLNSVGLQNPGVRGFIENELKIMRKCGTTVIVNFGDETVGGYAEGAAMLEDADIDMLELNISCPNVKHGGAAFGIKSEVAAEVVSAVRKAFKGSLMVKLSPSAEDISEMAKACEAAGADALSLINTVKAMAIDVYARKPVFANITAGLSGPAIRPIALRMVWEVAKAVSIPVVGLGGIMCGRDVIEFIMAGATAVQIGTANFTKPTIMLDILTELEAFMAERGINSLDEIRGCV